MSEHFESRVRRAKTTATSNNGSFATKTNVEDSEVLAPEAVDAFVPANYPPMQSADEHARLLAAVKAEDAVGGPESMTAAKSSLWRTVLQVDVPDLYGEEDDEGFHECYLCGAQCPSGEIDAHMRNDHPRAFTADDIDTDSKAKVEADFEQWVAENTDAVKAFTETVDNPDGRDPAEFLAHNWWLTKNGHGTAFIDRLADDPVYAEAVRERKARIDAYQDAMRTNPAGTETWSGLKEVKSTTPLDILREKAKRLRANAQRAGMAYRQSTFGGNEGPSSTYSGAWDQFRTADAAVRRAEALTVLAKATPTREYDIYVGDSWLVCID